MLKKLKQVLSFTSLKFKIGNSKFNPKNYNYKKIPGFF